MTRIGPLGHQQPLLPSAGYLPVHKTVHFLVWVLPLKKLVRTMGLYQQSIAALKSSHLCPFVFTLHSPRTHSLVWGYVDSYADAQSSGRELVFHPQCPLEPFIPPNLLWTTDVGQRPWSQGPRPSVDSNPGRCLVSGLAPPPLLFPQLSLSQSWT